MRQIFKCINIFLSIGLVLMVLGVLYVLIPYFGNQSLIVRSGSMSPAIDAGSVIVVRPETKLITPSGDKIPLYNKNDIIAFRKEFGSETIITHRIVDSKVEKNGVFYKTKGEENEDVDSWLVNELNIVGRAYIVLPLFGFLLAFAKSDLGFPIVIIMPAVFAMLLEFYSVIKDLRIAKKARVVAEIRTHLRHSSGYNREKHHLTGLRIIIPLLVIGMSVPVAFAFPRDTEKSINNVFTAAEVFSSPLPTSTPTPLPDTSPTATPSGEVQ